MKNQPTKEQVLDALQTHKTISNATKALGINHPTMMKLMKRYGIVANHNKKEETPESKEEAEQMDAEEKKKKIYKVLYYIGVGLVETMCIYEVVSSACRHEISGLTGWLAASIAYAGFIYYQHLNDEGYKLLAESVEAMHSMYIKHKTALRIIRDECERIANERPSIRGKYIKELSDSITKTLKEDE